MTTETTAPYVDEDGPIDGQRRSVEVLAELVAQFKDLPAAYTTIHTPWKGGPAALSMQLGTPTGFEQWRVALRIAPLDVDLYYCGDRSWVTAHGEHKGIPLSISAHGIALTAEQMAAPREATVTSANEVAA